MKVITAPTATLNNVGGWTRLIIAASRIAPNLRRQSRVFTVTATNLQIDRSPQADAQRTRGVEPEIAASVARSRLPFRSSTRVWALEGWDPSTHTPGKRREEGAAALVARPSRPSAAIGPRRMSGCDHNACRGSDRLMTYEGRVPPTASRLSCGALKKDSFHNLRAPPASRACSAATTTGSSWPRGGWNGEKRRHVSHEAVAFVEVGVMPAPVVVDKGGIGQFLCKLLKSPGNHRSITAPRDHQGRHRDIGEGSKLRVSSARQRR